MGVLTLGAAESFVNDFLWSWWCFQISVFDLVNVGIGERFDETVKRGEVTTIGTLDCLLYAVIARNSDRVSGAHVGEVPVGIGYATPFREPCFERLTVPEHCGKHLGTLSAGDTCEVTEKEGKIDYLVT